MVVATVAPNLELSALDDAEVVVETPQRERNMNIRLDTRWSVFTLRQEGKDGRDVEFWKEFAEDIFQSIGDANALKGYNGSLYDQAYDHYKRGRFQRAAHTLKELYERLAKNPVRDLRFIGTPSTVVALDEETEDGKKRSSKANMAAYLTKKAEKRLRDGQLRLQMRGRSGGGDSKGKGKKKR